MRMAIWASGVILTASPALPAGAEGPRPDRNLRDHLPPGKVATSGHRGTGSPPSDAATAAIRDDHARPRLQGDPSPEMVPFGFILHPSSF
jgi:hypothetical protein